MASCHSAGPATWRCPAAAPASSFSASQLARQMRHADAQPWVPGERLALRYLSLQTLLPTSGVLSAILGAEAPPEPGCWASEHAPVLETTGGLSAFRA